MAGWRGKGVKEFCVYYSRVDLLDLLQDRSWGTREKVGVCSGYFFFPFWLLYFKIGSHVSDFKITV